jgi:hypothetical protein
MQYMLMFLETDAELARRDSPTESKAYWGAWASYMTQLREAGLIVNGDGLLPPHTATRVSIQGGARVIQDGPHPDTKEHLGGYVVVEVKDLDAAIAIAERSPCARAGYTEIRPVMPPMPAMPSPA